MDRPSLLQPTQDICPDKNTKRLFVCCKTWKLKCCWAIKYIMRLWTVQLYVTFLEAKNSNSNPSQLYCTFWILTVIIVFWVRFCCVVIIRWKASSNKHSSPSFRFQFFITMLIIIARFCMLSALLLPFLRTSKACYRHNSCHQICLSRSWKLNSTVIMYSIAIITVIRFCSEMLRVHCFTTTVSKSHGRNARVCDVAANNYKDRQKQQHRRHYYEHHHHHNDHHNELHFHCDFGVGTRARKVTSWWPMLGQVYGRQSGTTSGLPRWIPLL